MLNTADILKRATVGTPAFGDLLIGLLGTYLYPEEIPENEVLINTKLNITKKYTYKGELVRPLYLTNKHVLHYYSVSAQRVGAVYIDTFLEGQNESL